MRNLHTRDARRYPVQRMCASLGVTKQSYYKYDSGAVSRKAAKVAFALEYIRGVRSVAPGIGSMKLWHMYCREFPGAERLGRDKFAETIDLYGLKVRKRVRKPRTTDSTHGLPVFPNLAFGFIPAAVNQLWVSDITYVPVWLDDEHYTFAYLSLIMDAYSHEVVGWAVGDTLATSHSIRALETALGRLDGNTHNLIHHSDRGVQYASREYVDRLRERGIQVSMTANGDPKENAMAERLNLTVKNELLRGLKFYSTRELEDAMRVAIDFYNTRRPHMSIDMMTPQEAAECNGEIRKWWHSYREDAIKRAIG